MKILSKILLPTKAGLKQIQVVLAFTFRAFFFFYFFLTLYIFQSFGKSKITFLYVWPSAVLE